MMTWQVLAGFTLGDGCIAMPPDGSAKAHHPSQIRVSWYQSENDIEILEAIDDFLADQGIKTWWHENRSATTFVATAPMWTLMTAGAEHAEAVLKEILPYLVGSKRRKALKALRRLKTLPRGREYKLQTHCKRGHPMTGNNLYVRSNGSRQCRSCMRLNEKRRVK